MPPSVSAAYVYMHLQLAYHAQSEQLRLLLVFWNTYGRILTFYGPIDAYAYCGYQAFREGPGDKQIHTHTQR